jgi:hypothetical protein
MTTGAKTQKQLDTGVQKKAATISGDRFSKQARVKLSNF